MSLPKSQFQIVIQIAFPCFLSTEKSLYTNLDTVFLAHGELSEIQWKQNDFSIHSMLTSHNRFGTYETWECTLILRCVEW